MNPAEMGGVPIIGQRRAFKFEAWFVFPFPPEVPREMILMDILNSVSMTARIHDFVAAKGCEERSIADYDRIAKAQETNSQ